MHDRALRSVRRSRNSRLSHGVISRLRGVAVGFNAQSKPLAGASEAGPWARIIRVIKEGGDGKVKQVAADKVIIALTKTKNHAKEFGDPRISFASVLIGERSPIAGCCERRCD